MKHIKVQWKDGRLWLWSAKDDEMEDLVTYYSGYASSCTVEYITEEEMSMYKLSGGSAATYDRVGYRNSTGI